MSPQCSSVSKASLELWKYPRGNVFLAKGAIGAVIGAWPRPEVCGARWPSVSLIRGGTETFLDVSPVSSSRPGFDSLTGRFVLFCLKRCPN